MPVINLTIETIRSKYMDFIRVSLPLIIIPIIDYLFNYYEFNRDSEPNKYFLLLVFIPYVLQIIVFTMVFVACHRVFLMADEDIKKIKTLRFGIREWNFFAWWIRIAVIGLIIFFPITMLFDDSRFDSKLLNYFIFIPFLYLISRLSLAFPATAVENKNISFKHVWELSKNNGWQLTLLVGFIPWVLDLSLNFINTQSLIVSIATNILWLIVGLFEIGLLSMSYAYLKGYVLPDSA